MTCSDFLQDFSDYVDGGGSRDFRERAANHLDTCASCRRYLHVYERGTDLLRASPRPDVPRDFRPRLRHRIYHIEDGPALSPATTGSATTAVTVLGMAALLVLAAWSPLLLDQDTEVAVSPIVVTRPATSPLGLRAVGSADLLDGTRGYSVRAGVAGGANTLLFQYSPLASSRVRPRVTRAGLD